MFSLPSSAVLHDNARPFAFALSLSSPSLCQPPTPEDPADLSLYVTELLSGLQDRFTAMSTAIVSRLDEMGRRIEELEANVADVAAQAGMQGAKPQ
jgi:heat shock factor-binding protein 1